MAAQFALCGSRFFVFKSLETMNSSLFISGVPCTGKSWLGSWLFDNEGFHHVDAEKDGGVDLDVINIHSEWDLALATGRADSLAQKIGNLSKPVVLNWGFPMSYVYFVKALQVSGIQTWWIRGDIALARKAFFKRGGINMEAFDKQVRDIEQHWLLLEVIFCDRIIEGLTAEGAQRPPADMWNEISNRPQMIQ